jgi:hypothetical protein
VPAEVKTYTGAFSIDTPFSVTCTDARPWPMVMEVSVLVNGSDIRVGWAELVKPNIPWRLTKIVGLRFSQPNLRDMKCEGEKIEQISVKPCT